MRIACLTIAALVWASAGVSGSVIVDDGDPGNTLIGGWVESGTGGEFAGDSKFTNVNGPNQIATYTTNALTPGIYAAEFYLPGSNGSDVVYSVTHDSGTATISVDQISSFQNSFTSLGFFQITGGSSTVTVDASNQPGNKRTDAIRWSRVDLDGISNFVTDWADGVSGFHSESGTWITSSINSGLWDAGANNDRISNTEGSTGGFSNLPLVLERYELFISWDGTSNRANNALVRVTDADGNVTDHRVNQRVDPVGNTLYDTGWYSLGEYQFDASSTVEFIVDDQAGGFVVVDGLRARIIPEPTSLALIGLGAIGLVTRRRRHG